MRRLRRVKVMREVRVRMMRRGVMKLINLVRMLVSLLPAVFFDVPLLLPSRSRSNHQIIDTP